MTGQEKSRGGMVFRRGGHGPAVVLVHGIPGAAAAWDQVAAALPEGIDLVVPDLLGFGGSEMPLPPTIASLGPSPQSKALEDLLDEIGVRGAVLVGHDFGGPVSVLLADRRPDLVSALLLLSANTFPDTPIPFPLSLTTAPVVGSLVAKAMFSRRSLAMMLRRGTGEGAPPDAARYIGGPEQQRAIASIFGGALRQLRGLYSPVEAALRRLEVPVVVGWGDRDPFFPVAQGRRTAETASGQLHVFSGAGHFLPHEQPRAVALHIAKLVGERTG